MASQGLGGGRDKRLGILSSPEMAELSKSANDCPRVQVRMETP